MHEREGEEKEEEDGEDEQSGEVREELSGDGVDGYDVQADCTAQCEYDGEVDEIHTPAAECEEGEGGKCVVRLRTGGRRQ